MRPATLPAVLAAAAEAHPDRDLLVFEGRAWSYGRFAERIRAVAGTLRAWGLRPGDRVALYLDNSPSFLVAYLAVLWCGAAVVPVNARYRDGELRHMLGDAGARLVVSDVAGRATVAAVRPDAPSVVASVELSGCPDADEVAWRRLAPQAVPAGAPPDDGDALALVAYTSGTTGRSKGAMLTHAQLLANARAVSTAWGWTAADRLLLCLPLFHVHGLAVGFHGTLVRGATALLHRRFNPAEVLRTLEAGEASLFFGVPTMYRRLLDEAGERRVRAPGLRLLVSGSAPLPVDTLERVAAAFGHRILERYGMTETVMLSGNPLEGPRKPGTVGRPFEGVELRLADPVTGKPVTPGSTGEVHVRGPSVTRGYWRDAVGTAAAFTSDGWFRTGDLGFLDGDGYLTLSGRARELIISGGFNVYPREVEDQVAAVPGVREVAVLGLPDPDLGEQVVAAVVVVDATRDTGPASATAYRGERDASLAEAIMSHCKQHLAGFKAPMQVFVVDRLPRNAMGKLLRHELRAALLEELPTDGRDG